MTAPRLMPAGGWRKQASAAEQYYYIPSDGSTTFPLTLASGDRDVLTFDGGGLPPIEYITERGPFQHGESIRAYWLRPRIVQLLYRQNFCSRQDTLTGAETLMNAIRPNRTNGPTGVLRKIYPNGAKRDLNVAPVEGPRFEARRLDEWDEWSIQEVLRFIAHDPVWFNPTENVEQFGPCSDGTGFPYTFPFPFSVDCQLVFPATFPITFEGFDFTDILTNAGNWQEYPRFVIYGPAQYITITNETTNESLRILDYRIEAGEYATIDLRYGVKTFVLNDGTNLIRYIEPDSDWATFHFEPGENVVRIQIGSAGAAAYVQAKWYDRYLGIK